MSSLQSNETIQAITEREEFNEPAEVSSNLCPAVQFARGLAALSGSEEMMTEQTTSSGVDPNSVRKVMHVQAPVAVAWRVFTEKMGAWWPLATYKIGQAKALDAVIEPRVGGRWYELGDDGSTCDWGRVLSWEPHSRLVLSWDISAHWQPDPNLKTEIEVCFIAEDKNGTRVELEHRHLDRYGARRDEMRRIFDTGGGWGKLLEMFAGAAATAYTEDTA
jgi:uncharacterized protein YndB with AHSA1/START domain